MRLKVFGLAFFCLIILCGCSIKETVKNSSEQELKERGAMYWGYICNQQFDKAYEFEYPLYRKTVSMIDYIRRIRTNMSWKNASIEKIDVQDDTAMMTVKVDTDIKMVMSQKVARKVEINSQVVMDEKWIRVDGIWYHVPQQFKGAK